MGILAVKKHTNPPYLLGTVKEKLHWTLVKNGKKGFVQDYCSRGGRLNFAETEGEEVSQCG